MIGENVSHIRFGAGKVTAFAPPRIEIAFLDGTVKTFAYPQSVGRFLRFAGAEAQARAQRDLEQAEMLARESAMVRLLEDRQRAEEAARQRRELLHDRKIAAAKRTAGRSAAARKMKTGGSTP